jgi:protein TonB
MKLDIKNQWLEIVFEGRNKVLGAYELRKSKVLLLRRLLVLCFQYSWLLLLY